MTEWIGLLRGINVGGRNVIAMSDLRDLLASLGFAGAHSLLQSGNLVFRGAAGAGAALEQRLEAETAKRLAVRPDWLVRTAREWRALVAANPFPAEARRDPARLAVMLLKQPPKAADLRALQVGVRGPETVRGAGRELYVVYPDGMGRSKLTGALIEGRLGVRGTARNWNTVLRIAALLGA